jgi:hypothetical protein
MATVSFGSLMRCVSFSTVAVPAGWREPGVEDPFCPLAPAPD